MLIFPTCKINLGLSIIAKREDGFHNVETVLYPLPLKDILEILPAKDKGAFALSGIPIPGHPEDNLVYKAYQLIHQEYGIGPVNIHLHKTIPAGAGLGGGSSDAAHAILLINEIFALGLTIDRMEDYARKLGSDCAFFIRNSPILASGKGDQFAPVKVLLDDYHILLVKPAMNINTAEAYGWVRPEMKDKYISSIIELPVTQWKGKLINDFEAPVFSRYPDLVMIKKKIVGLGAVYASMTGTGSAVYGIFRKNNIPEVNLKFPGSFVWHSWKNRI